MSLLASLGRVFASAEILSTVDQSIANELATPLMLMLSADLHWRLKEWQAAIDMASRAVAKRPKDFHALSILVTSYGHLQKFDAAYPYAKRLVLASPPSWKAIKSALALLMAFHLLTVKGRAGYRRTMLRCEQEARVDSDALTWAHELISMQEAANGPVAV